ncbi:hypothetical protein PCH_Pc12g04830 [Penicillium rubens Wisconsin 54-1255]|uniref:Uncharacterized protein n=1 Tax=Penicillium rubens (strain ATCC 28089 / DSM 1075 / NRRL 1951 / Wisconsin 54-1255) TaxID=500485 RepID=B6GYJ2_PENRW|nr:hypothetical protein PCH_Pc12g04830 [Penicillium rubens Wisconsin 54-1255]
MGDQNVCAGTRQTLANKPYPDHVIYGELHNQMKRRFPYIIGIEARARRSSIIRSFRDSYRLLISRILYNYLINKLIISKIEVKYNTIFIVVNYFRYYIDTFKFIRDLDLDKGIDYKVIVVIDPFSILYPARNFKDIILDKYPSNDKLNYPYKETKLINLEKVNIDPISLNKEDKVLTRGENSRRITIDPNYRIEVLIKTNIDTVNPIKDIKLAISKGYYKPIKIPGELGLKLKKNTTSTCDRTDQGSGLKSTGFSARCLRLEICAHRKDPVANDPFLFLFPSLYLVF